MSFIDVQLRETGSASSQRHLGLHSRLDTEPARTAAVGKVLGELRSEGVITGWRDELYPVVSQFGAQPSLLLERAAAPHFGIKAYGVHINGYVVGDDGDLKLWIARRSKDKPTWPGKLDHIAAGGQPHGISLHDNVVKECGEEAGIPAELAQTAKCKGAVSYTSLGADGHGLKRDVLFVYDLEVPGTFQPEAVDGEVDEFVLMRLSDVLEKVAFTDEFKDNCGLVIIDFAIRHGAVDPQAPGYLRLVQDLRSGDCS